MKVMRNRLIIRTILATGCCLLCAAASFPQSLAKAPKLIPKRKKANATSHATAAGAETRTYKVKQGDTLYHIAATTGTNVAALKSANGLRTNQLQIGQKLILPGSPQEARQIARTTANAAPKPPKAEQADVGADDAAPEEAGPAQAPNVTIPPKNGDAAGEDAEAQPLRYRLASMGLGFLGVRYRRSGESEQSGFDCSGLVKTLFEKFQISLPRSSREQFKVGAKVDKDSLEVGDLVFFSSRGKVPSHVGIYIGENQFLHAALKAKRVLVSNLTSPWYVKRFLGARRFLDLWKDEPKADEPKSESKSNH